MNYEDPDDPYDGDECIHIWHYIEDWEGDTTLHNGTNDLSHWECELCGDTTDTLEEEDDSS